MEAEIKGIGVKNAIKALSPVRLAAVKKRIPEIGPDIEIIAVDNDKKKQKKPLLIIDSPTKNFDERKVGSSQNHFMKKIANVIDYPEDDESEEDLFMSIQRQA